MTPPCPERRSLLAERLGYFENSHSNTLALVRKFELEDSCQTENGNPVPADASDEIKRCVERIPDRQILDFLLQYFVNEVDWIDRLIHPSWFLAQYQQWWTKEELACVADLDFAILMLRICAYASQFLPSPSYTIDRIRGVLLVDIRKSCDEVACTLAAIANRLDTRGSLVRIQHLCFLGLSRQNEGKMHAFLESLGSAIRVAQDLGIHLDASSLTRNLGELEKEMYRRVLCNLYIWDSRLARQLDRVPFLPDGLHPGNWPQMRLVYAVGDGEELDPSAPEGFSERLLQTRLADFWRSSGCRQGVEYDIMAAEDRYEKFCRDFVTNLPPAFSLQPNKAWDKRLPKLPLQRQLLHISIFDSLCWNLRPLLLHSPDRLQCLPAYKQVLLSSQKKALAVAALRMLDALSSLHAMLGGCHTCFSAIIFPTFEAATLLVCLSVDPEFPDDDNDNPPSGPGPCPLKFKTDPLHTGMGTVTRASCIQAAHDALNRLRMLAEVSDMAEVEAQTLSRALAKVCTIGTNQDVTQPSSYPWGLTPTSDMANCPYVEPPDPALLADYLSVVGSRDLYSNLETFVGDLDYWPAAKPGEDTTSPKPAGRQVGPDLYPFLDGFWVKGMDPKVGYGLRY
ncbi:hypothetical protein N8T08_006943 [Aspergillus melleus]|uniref:Uncharacterized protein n=1 Tax=Aspergillus melleus TaxID=138277 RepID=A0ACC3AZC0_9EURO|nr:hypothetical protein N8T08_006943 [Aspergillus melleus]